MPRALKLLEKDGGVTFDILVAPRASRQRLGPVVGQRLKIAVTAPPVEGKANEAIIALIAQALHVRRQEVTILAGAKGKRKTVHVTGITLAAIEALLEVL